MLPQSNAARLLHEGALTSSDDMKWSIRVKGSAQKRETDRVNE